VLRLEIGPPEPNLMKPIVYARRSGGSLAVHIGKFRSDIVKSENFDMQAFNNMGFHRSAITEFFATYVSGIPVIFSGGDPKSFQRT
jgi:hypothetical protein